MCKLENGKQYFYQVITPKNCRPSYVLVYFHGYTSHSDTYLEFFAGVARKGAIVLLIDLPNHGRSDGLLCYIPDWWTWVDEIWSVVDHLVPPLRADDSLPVFGTGLSLGGGLTCCLAIQRPNFFNGIVLVAPMLFVSDEIKPPWIVQMVFKYLLRRLLPYCPITPSKDMDQFDFRVPEQGYAFTGCNPLGMCGWKARLGTAYSLGFVFPDWMERQLSNLRTPFLVMHGSCDKVTDPTMSERLYQAAIAKDKEFKKYDGVYHCEAMCCLPGHEQLIGMKFLPEQKAVTDACMQDMCAWLKARSK
eukprot:TRINITY_DN19225_c0_g1_i2.p1 TRINITY_DN19225_c0_g1~~TRINITY_DN19225_c0_g1_i2.p1  ORF type:complete len:303 (-),score=23.43 TRINITY_DN19225_c0_g1_i2:233-1141(-)